MQSLLFVIVSVLLLWALPYLIAYGKVLKQTFLCFHPEPVSPEILPDHLKTLFQPTIAQLKTYGFQVVEHHLIQSMTGGSKRWDVLFQHRSQQIYAGCAPAQLLNSANPLLLSFSSFLEDGRLLFTTNVEMTWIYSQNPQEIAQYMGSTVSIDEQWQAHQRKLAEMSQPQTLSIAAFTESWKHHSRTNVKRLVQTKEVYWVEPGESYRMTWWTTATAIVKTARRKQRNKVQSHQIPTVGSTIDLEVDEFFQQQHQRQQGKLSPKSKRWLTWGTLGLFVAVYALRFNPQWMILFVATLLLHEGGHVLAMKWFGYRDATMLFIPFLGALATARKDNASLTEKVWISLAGPLPGLILGIGLAVVFNTFSDPMVENFQWVRQASEILITLNLFNLLPVYPLDGGQVADLLLFSRNPYLGVVFKAIGVVLLALLGLRQPLFLGFAVLISRTIPYSFRLAKLNAALRPELQQLPSDKPEAIVRFLFTKLQDSRDRSLPFAQKYALVLGLLETHQEHSAKWTTRVGLSGIYLISLIAGIVGGLYSFIPNLGLLGHTFNSLLQDPRVAYQKRIKHSIDQATNRLQTNPKDIQAYLDRGRAKSALKDYQGAIADANQIIQLDPGGLAGYELRAGIRKRSSDQKGAEADFAKVKSLRTQQLTQRLQQLNQVLRQHPKDTSAYLDRAGVHAELNHYAAAIADCSQVLKLDARNTQALLSRGDLYVQMKDYHRAIADANQIISFQPDSFEAYMLRSEAREQLGDQAGAETDTQKSESLDQAQTK